MSAATPARRWPAPAIGRWSTTTCRAATATAVRWGPLVEGDLHDRARLAEALRAHRIMRGHAFRGVRLCRRVGGRPRDLLPEQRRRHSRAARGDARGGRRTPRLLLDLRGLRRPGQRCRSARPPRKAPLNPYGDTKLAIERALHWYAGAYGLRYVALRYFNAAGADPDGEIGEDHEPETHLIPLVLRAALGRGGRRSRSSAPIIRRRTAPRSATTSMSTDLADAHVRALADLAAGGDSARAQPRHRQGPFGARGGRRGRADRRPPGAAARGRAPAGRSAGARRRPGARR